MLGFSCQKSIEGGQQRIEGRSQKKAKRDGQTDKVRYREAPLLKTIMHGWCTLGWSPKTGGWTKDNPVNRCKLPLNENSRPYPTKAIISRTISIVILENLKSLKNVDNTNILLS